MRGRYNQLKRDEQALIGLLEALNTTEKEWITENGLPLGLRSFTVALNFTSFTDLMKQEAQYGEQLAEVLGQLYEARVNR